MQIIFGKQNAENLRPKYIVLDLEVMEVDTPEGKQNLEVYCLVPAEKISINDLQNVEIWTQAHNDFLTAYADKNYAYCRAATEHLIGRFGGEVDTFYEEILKRIDGLEAQ